LLSGKIYMKTRRTISFSVLQPIRPLLWALVVDKFDP